MNWARNSSCIRTVSWPLSTRKTYTKVMPTAQSKISWRLLLPGNSSPETKVDGCSPCSLHPDEVTLVTPIQLQNTSTLILSLVWAKKFSKKSSKLVNPTSRRCPTTLPIISACQKNIFDITVPTHLTSVR